MSSHPVQFTQQEYSQKLYKSETKGHRATVDEYGMDIFKSYIAALDLNKANMELYRQQPYLTFPIRLKLIDFLLKMSVRLKILPFVFFKAVKLFDRYCSKRVILLDQSQLIITTCLWIASKLQGGNNHFINLNNIDKVESIKTINDLGYGSGGKYLGPTERFRLPKLHELVKLCGAKCKYDQSMFKQMELHILATLDWSFNDPSIEDFIVQSNDFNILVNNEFFKVKEYLSYVTLFSSELIDISIIDLGKVMVDLINEIFNLSPDDYHFQSLNRPSFQSEFSDEIFPDEEDDLSDLYNYKLDYHQYKFIKKNLIKAILKSTDYVLKMFNSKGPQFLYRQIVNNYKESQVFSISETKKIPPPYQLYDHSTTTIPVLTTPSSPRISMPNAPATPVSMHSGSPGPLYKPVPINSNTSCVLTKITNIYETTGVLPKIITTKPHHQHHHNNSQASLNSAVSRDNDLFEYDVRRNGIYTPVSDEESPVFSQIKQFEGRPLHHYH